MKVLVTGATGEVGSELVQELLQRGVGVRALTRRQRTPDTFPEAVEMAVGDLSDPVSIGEAIKGVDKLFLLIGAENVPVELTQALTAYGLAKKAGLKHVTYASIYGNARNSVESSGSQVTTTLRRLFPFDNCGIRRS